MNSTSNLEPCGARVNATGTEPSPEGAPKSVGRSSDPTKHLAGGEPSTADGAFQTTVSLRSDDRKRGTPHPRGNGRLAVPVTWHVPSQAGTRWPALRRAPSPRGALLPPGGYAP